MANTNAPFGLRPLGIYGAAQPTMELETGKVAAAVPNALYRGDPLVRLNTGYLDHLTAGTSVAAFVGIFWGAKYLSTAFGRTVVQQFLPTTDVAADATVYYIPCNNFPSPLLAVQASLAPVTFANIGENADIIVGAGSVKGAYGLSGYVLNSTTATANPTYPFKVVGLLSDYFPAGTPGTDNASNYNIVVVSPNTAQLAGV